VPEKERLLQYQSEVIDGVSTEVKGHKVIITAKAIKGLKLLLNR